MMKVLYITQYFLTPDQAGGGRHYYQAKYLKAQGHQVDVITAYVQDHMSRVIPRKYRGKIFVAESCEGIPVYKTYASANYGQGFMDRMKNYLSFMFCAILVGLRIPGRYDIVFASSPSLFVGLAGYILAIFKRGSFVLEVRDLWPQSAVVLGFLKNRIFINWAKRLERFLYRRALAVIALTAGICDAVCQSAGNKNKVTLITNGVDDDLFIKSQPLDYQAIHGLEGKFIAVYAGSHGVNNDIETMIHAAAKLRNNPEIHFVFVGGGDHKPKLINLCQDLGLDNILFIPPRPKNQIASYLTGADVCLLAIKKDPFFNGTLPNKLFDYLASSKPIVASVPKNGESARLISELGGGIICDPEDPEQMAQAIWQVYRHRDTYGDLGQNVKANVLKNFSRYHLAAEFEAVLIDTLKRLKNG